MNDYYYGSALPGESRGGSPLSSIPENDLPVIYLEFIVFNII